MERDDLRGQGVVGKYFDGQSARAQHAIVRLADKTQSELVIMPADGGMIRWPLRSSSPSQRPKASLSAGTPSGFSSTVMSRGVPYLPSAVLS